jgi:hypothetical protein
MGFWGKINFYTTKYENTDKMNGYKVFFTGFVFLFQLLSMFAQSEAKQNLSAEIEVNKKSLFITIKAEKDSSNYTSLPSAKTIEILVIKNGLEIYSSFSAMSIKSSPFRIFVDLQELGLPTGEQTLTVVIKSIDDYRKEGEIVAEKEIEIDFPEVKIYHLQVGDYYIDAKNSDISFGKVLDGKDRKNADPFMVLSAPNTKNIFKTEYVRNSSVAIGFTTQFKLEPPEYFTLNVIDKDFMSPNDNIDFFQLSTEKEGRNSAKGLKNHTINYTLFSIPNNLEPYFDASLTILEGYEKGAKGKYISFDNSGSNQQIFYRLIFKNMANVRVWETYIQTGRKVFFPDAHLLDVRKVTIEKCVVFHNKKIVLSSFSKDCWIENFRGEFKISSVKVKTGTIQKSYTKYNTATDEKGVMLSYVVELPTAYIEGRFVHEKKLNVSLCGFSNIDQNREIQFLNNVQGQTKFEVRESYSFAELGTSNGTHSFSWHLRPHFGNDYFDTIYQYHTKIKIKGVKRYGIQVVECEWKESATPFDVVLWVNKKEIGVLSMAKNKKIEVTLQNKQGLEFRRIIGNSNLLTSSLFSIQVVKVGIIDLPLQNELGKYFKKLTLEIKEIF